METRDPLRHGGGHRHRRDPCFAQSSEGQDTEKALLDAHNPIATTITVPFQSNTYFSAGPLEKTTNVLIIQPVIPIARTAKWNVISRWVTRVVYVPRRSPDQGSEFGLGNLQPEFYFSPAHPGKVIGVWARGSICRLRQTMSWGSTKWAGDLRPPPWQSTGPGSSASSQTTSGPDPAKSASIK